MNAHNTRIDLRLVVIAAVGIGLMALGVLLVTSVGATIDGDFPPGYGDWVINQPTTVDGEFIWLTDGNITVNSKLVIENSYIFFDFMMYPIEYDFHITAGGSLSLEGTIVSHMFGLGIEYIFEGPVYIDNCELYYAWNGIQIMNDNVEIHNTYIGEAYNLGVHIMRCDPLLDNVYIEVPYGYWTIKQRTDKAWGWDTPLMLACPNGVWVEGGAPSFMDVIVWTRSEARFEVEYTGRASSVLINVWAAGAPVLIESRDIVDVSGITAEYSRFNLRMTVTATDPSPNPQRIEVYMQPICAGILIKDYSSVTITGVDAVGCAINSRYLSVTGGSSSNYGYTYSSQNYRVVTAVVGIYSTSPTTSATFKDFTTDDGGLLYTHLYAPDYSGTGIPVFTDKVHITDLDVGNYGDPIIMIRRSCSYDGPREFIWDTQITSSSFHDMYGSAVQYMANAGPGLDPTQHTLDVTETIKVDNNTFADCYLDWNPLLYIDGIWENLLADVWDRTVDVADNTMTSIDGPLFYIYSIDSYQAGTETVQFVDNDVQSCGQDPWYGSSMFYIEYFENVRFLGNTFTDVAYSYPGYIYDAGGDTNGIKATDILFDQNEFSMCMAYYYPTFFELYFGGEATFTMNSFSEGTGLVYVEHLTDYVGNSKLTMSQNDYSLNTGPMVYYVRADEAQKHITMQIDNNTFNENADYFIDYEWSEEVDTQDNDGLILFMDNTVSDNLGGCVHAWGDVRLINNDFTNNQGPLATIDYINLHLPMLTGNSYTGNVDVFELLGKDRGYQLVPMQMSDLSIGCTGTALALSNLEVRMDRVSIPNADVAILAQNSIVDLYDSSVNGKDCEVVGDGRITLWWPAEVKVNWADATGVDSMMPAAGALVVFYDNYGGYYYSANTDNNGFLAASFYREWGVDVDGSWSYSPYKVKIASAGAANEHSVVIDGDKTGTKAIQMLLWDSFTPVVAITDPLGGDLFDNADVPTFGFISEIGSGLTKAESSRDGGATWDPLVVDMDTGDWTIPLMDLGDGEHTLLVRAYDVAGNMQSTSVTFKVDTKAPVITVSNPGDGEIFNMPSVDISGDVDEAGVKVFINGMQYNMDGGMAFAKELTLNEGINIIIIEAIDMAGNHATATIMVMLDTFAPVLVLTSPANGMLTREGMVTVTGIVEVGATLLVNGVEVAEDPDGSFSKVVDLSEGTNEIEVKAIDEAGNTNVQVRSVVRDSIAPTVSIVEPGDGTVVRTGQIQVRVNAAPDATVYLNGRMLPTKGLVNRTVLLVEGSNKIIVQAIDAAGNVATDEITVILDTVAPVLTVTNPAGMEVWTNVDAITIAGSAMGATAVTVNGIAATFNSATGDFSAQVALATGENNMTVMASDGANMVDMVIKAWLSTARPLLVVNAVPASVQQPSVTISGRTDPGIKHVSLKVGSETLVFDVAYDGTFAVKLNLADGQYTAEVSVTDVFGNIATESTTPFTVKAMDLTGKEEGGGLSIQPMGIGAVIAAIAITLALVTWMVVRSRRD